MQLPRVIVAAVFFVIGALIAIPSLMASGTHRGGHVSPWEWALAVAIIVTMIIVTFIDATSARRRRDAARNIEADRLRRAAGLPSSRADIDLAVGQLEKRLSKKLTKLERTLDDLQKDQAPKGLMEEVGDVRQELSRMKQELEREEGFEEYSDQRLGTLVEIYIQAKGQLGSSYRIGQVVATAGGSLLFLGVVLALLRPGQATPAILAVVGGSVTNLTSGVFFAQTNRAREHLERQATALRDDVRSREVLEQSTEIINTVQDVRRQDDLRAQVVLRILAGGDRESGSSVDDLPAPPQRHSGRFRSLMAAWRNQER